MTDEWHGSRCLVSSQIVSLLPGAGAPDRIGETC
jgi:hypothetical protein